jgi:hypothetical protein
MKHSDDQTLFAWELHSKDIESGISGPFASEFEICGPLATSPSMFRGCSDLVPIPDADAPAPYSMMNKGLRLELPIVKRNEQRRGVAILQCSTTTSFPRRITLPIVQVNEEDNSNFARDGRYTYPLKTARLYEMKDSVTKVIYMKQDPEYRVLSRRAFVEVLQCNTQPWYGYRPLYSSPKLVATPPDSDNLTSRHFSVPSGHRRGAILYGVTEPDVLVLYSVEMQHRGRYSCKVLRIDPRPQFRHFKTSVHSKHMRIQRLLSGVKKYAIKYDDPSDPWGSEVVTYHFRIEQKLKELHAYYTTGSDSRTSSTYLEYEHSMVILANIAPQVVGGQFSLVLEITLLDPSEAPLPFFELYGDAAEGVREENVEEDEDLWGDEYVGRGEDMEGDEDTSEDEEATEGERRRKRTSWYEKTKRYEDRKRL